MKPYVILPYVKDQMRQVHVPTARNPVYSAPGPLNFFSEDASFTLNTVYFADDEEHARQAAVLLIRRFPTYNFIVARTIAIIDMPRQENVQPTIKTITEKGLLP